MVPVPLSKLNVIPGNNDPNRTWTVNHYPSVEINQSSSNGVENFIYYPNLMLINYIHLAFKLLILNAGVQEGKKHGAWRRRLFSRS